MQKPLVQLFADFFSTIVFLTVYLTTGNLLIATAVGIAGAIGQIIYIRIRQQSIDVMTWASLGLVIVLGAATLMTRDPRFVLMKPAVVHFAIGAVMLRRNWMARYPPPIVRETIPHYVTGAGYAWALLMFALGLGTVIVAQTGDLGLWALYVSIIAVGAKILAFGIQYIVFYIAIARRMRTA